MTDVLLKDLVESGAHFGHKVSLWNPKMKQYIYGSKKRIHIIDVRETVKGMVNAAHLLKRIVQKGGEAIIVGIKRQAQHIVKSEATRCGMHYASDRWIGGTLTNFDTIRLQIRKLFEMEKKATDGTLSLYKKKEQVVFRRELERLRINLGGIRNITRLPAVLVAVDYKKSKLAIKEAQKIGIPSICLIDTDGDPSDVTLAIPINDDGTRSIQIVISYLANAIIEAKSKMEVKPLEGKNAPVKAVKVIAKAHTAAKPEKAKG
ncbi:MAG: 30S ribosomal protein S2 [Candidatus Brocadiia bacterium]